MAEPRRTLACMRCGSDRIRHQTSGEGLWPGGGEGVAWVCDACHHIGPPFVMDPRADSAADTALWQAEWESAAFAVDEAAWNEEGEPTRRPVLGALLLALATLFLLPAAYAVGRAIVSGSLFFVLWALVGSGWLIAIGLVLAVVGGRMLRRGSADAPDAARSEGPGGNATDASEPDDASARLWPAE